MSEERPEADETPRGSVFGKLPDSRPGRRSPRRDAAGRASKPKPKPAAQARKRSPSAGPRRPAPQAEPRRRQAAKAPPPAAAQPDLGQQGGGLDDLAWAGVAAIAEAATFGVRLANRALGAVRGGGSDDDEHGDQAR